MGHPLNRFVSKFPPESYQKIIVWETKKRPWIEAYNCALFPTLFLFIMKTETQSNKNNKWKKEASVVMHAVAKQTRWNLCCGYRLDFSQEYVVAVTKTEHFTDENKRANPFERIAAIEHDGFPLTKREVNLCFSGKTILYLLMGSYLRLQFCNSQALVSLADIEGISISIGIMNDIHMEDSCCETKAIEQSQKVRDCF